MSKILVGVCTFKQSRARQQAIFVAAAFALWGSFSSCGPDFIGSSRLQAGLCGQDYPAWNE